MPNPAGLTESWKRMVLRAIPPAWLAADAPQSDVVLSSRSRIMRNLAGHRFPHCSDRAELEEVLRKVSGALGHHDGFVLLKHLSKSERDYLVGSRLCSPHFKAEEPGRALLLDKARSSSVMVNEEDHIRIQAITAGWSVDNADSIADRTLRRISPKLDFAVSPRFAYLAASPYNAGQGRRLSAMFHLIGLAHAKRLPSVLKALSSRSLSARGLFGESSRAVGAFLQISITDCSRTEFSGACDYLLREEREARRAVGTGVLRERALHALQFVEASHGITLADALRVLGYARWGASASVKGLERSPRDVDLWLTTLELQGFSDSEPAMLERARFLREKLEGKN